MIVVAIIGTMAVYILPGMGGFMAGSRSRESAYHLLRMARQARSMAMRDGVAWYMRFIQADGAHHGALWRYRGMTSRCSRVDWGQAIGSGGFAPSDGHGNWGEYLDMKSYNQNRPGQVVAVSDTDRHVLQATAFLLDDASDPPTVTPMTVLNFCYEPSGQVWISQGPGSPEVLVRQNRRILFEIHHTVAGSEQGGAQRRVVFYPGAQPRIYTGIFDKP